MDDREATRRYVAQGRQAITELIQERHAVIRPEIEARIADTVWRTLSNRVEPHHLSTARRELVRAGEIEEIVATTKGGSQEPVLVPATKTGIKRAVADAAARKRLLAARYHGWGRSFIGPAGERVTHASLLAAAPAGYIPLRPTGGDIAEIFGRPVPIGPIDNAAHLTLLDSSGRPSRTVTILVEVKNIQHWIYPQSQELYELLDKAARLQLDEPDYPFVPVLVCRRASYTTMKMALQLGFFIAMTTQQFILPVAEVEPPLLRELVIELGLDILRTQDAHQPLVRRFERAIPQVATRTAVRFTETARLLGEYFSELRRESLRGLRRGQMMNRLRRAAVQHSTFNGGW